jgi:hypothetical protein
MPRSVARSARSEGVSSRVTSACTARGFRPMKSAAAMSRSKSSEAPICRYQGFIRPLEHGTPWGGTQAIPPYLVRGTLSHVCAPCGSAAPQVKGTYGALALQNLRGVWRARPGHPFDGGGGTPEGSAEKFLARQCIACDGLGREAPAPRHHDAVALRHTRYVRYAAHTGRAIHCDRWPGPAYPGPHVIPACPVDGSRARFKLCSFVVFYFFFFRQNLKENRVADPSTDYQGFRSSPGYAGRGELPHRCDWLLTPSARGV